MNKRQRKKHAYKKYIKDIFEGYEKMLENPTLEQLKFGYLQEETVLSRDEKGQIRFRTYDI